MNLRRKERLKKGFFKTGEIAKEAGVLPSCIRYYTKLELLDVHSRTQGNFRLYKRKETLERLNEIKSLKAQAMPLKIIKERLESV